MSCDVYVRHRIFGSRRFERTQPAHLRCSILQDETSTLFRNVGNEISRYPVCVSFICCCRSVLQATYRDATVGSGLMEPEGDGRPLLSLQDLESRLVFTRCKVSVCRIKWRSCSSFYLRSGFVLGLSVKIKGDYFLKQQNYVSVVKKMQCVFCEVGTFYVT
jgi:hypothetical protein